MNNDKQIEYVIKKYVIPQKEFDFNEIKTQEELIDIKEGLEKFNNLPDEKAKELLLKYMNENEK